MGIEFSMSKHARSFALARRPRGQSGHRSEVLKFLPPFGSRLGGLQILQVLAALVHNLRSGGSGGPPGGFRRAFERRACRERSCG